MKEKILLTIYNAFEKWSAIVPSVCTKGCSTCCTQNVTITAQEGERILGFIQREGLEQWFAGRLPKSGPTTPAAMTTNEYAAACLQGTLTDDPDNPGNSAPCPFLEKNCCGIYSVRPFGCRCFASARPCASATTAFLPDYYIAASAALMQIIEHLGQHEYWGNMLDVLPALCDMSIYKNIADLLPDRTMIIQARLRTRRAKPLPGFLLLAEEQEKIAPLLDTIFSTRIEEKRIDDILNNRERASVPPRDEKEPC
jgi:Fe-S-cluster containining protein